MASTLTYHVVGGPARIAFQVALAARPGPKWSAPEIHGGVDQAAWAVAGAGS